MLELSLLLICLSSPTLYGCFFNHYSYKLPSWQTALDLVWAEPLGLAVTVQFRPFSSGMAGKEK